MLKVLSQCVFACALLLSVSVSAQVANEVFEFGNESDRIRYQKMIDELRCPKCQNQNLSGSNSPIAQDLRKETYRLINEGADDEEILDFMVARYGDYVRYRPEVTSSTYALWYGPLALLLVALLVVVRLVLAKRKAASAPTCDEAGVEQATSESPLSSADLSDTEQQRLAQLLAGHAQPDSAAESKKN